MRTFDFKDNPQYIKDIFLETLKNPGSGYGQYPDSCIYNPDEIMSLCEYFIASATKYAWLKYLTRNEKAPEDYYVFIQPDIDHATEPDQDRVLSTVYLGMNNRFGITTEINGLMGLKKAAIVCRRKDQPIKACITGLKEVNFPRGLINTTGNWTKIFGLPERAIIQDYIITYSLARVKPDMPKEELPLLIGTNPVMEQWAEKRLK